MIGTTRNIRVFAYPLPCDLRKGFNGLSGLVTGHFKEDILKGDLFLFVNRVRKSAKALYFDGTGLCVFMKRLERGRFAKLWRGVDERPLELTTSELSLFLEGSEQVGRIKLSPARFVPAAVSFP